MIHVWKPLNPLLKSLRPFALVILSVFITALSLQLVSAPGFAVGTDDDDPPHRSTPQPTDYTAGKQAIEAEDWATAIRHFEKVVAIDPKNANAWNYLAYSHRQLDQLDKAFAYYEKALALDPEHLGALEYLGEAYLQVDDPDQANAQLEKLEAICGTECEEYQELAEAIEEYTKDRGEQ